ncbi:MAG: hypothetical protein JXA74_04595, partial [Anaerolineae bacterium]|nr:hypothetical protein [Anaerolineae bacterium]
MAMFRGLADISLDDLAAYGGKAARLGEALRLGCPVLPGMVLSTDLYRRFMQQGGLQGEIASILSALQPSALAQFQAAEWAIRSAFQVRRLPNEVSETIRAAWAAMGGIPLAVRSSALWEDSPQRSFVGQHESFLGIEGEEAVIQAVLGCWMSLFSAKALAYAQRFRVDLVRSAMAVILQPMIHSEAHGALFNVDPITGNPDIFVLEVKAGPQTGIHRLRPYERSPGESPHWTRLRYYGLMLGETQLAYQGIEWTISEDRVYLMRVRPLTSVPPYLPLGSSDVGATGRQLRLNRPQACEARALRPYSWYHRSLSAKFNAASVREANRLFSAHLEREEYYVCGYLYLWTRQAGLPAYDMEISPLRRLLHSLRRLYAARHLDRPYQALWRRAAPILAELAEIDLSTLSKRELHTRLSQTIDLEEAFWVERGRLGNCDQALADIFSRLFTRWVGDDPDTCELLVQREGDQLARSHDELCQLAQVRYASPEEESRAFAGFFRRHRHLFVPSHHLTNLEDVRQIAADRDQARELWNRLKHDDEAVAFCAERAQRAQRREVA